MPRPEFRNRCFTFYFSSEKEMAEWTAYAAQTGHNLASLVRYSLESTKARENALHELPQTADSKSNQAEIEALREELRIKSKLLEKQEAELYKLKHSTFKSPWKEGIAQYDKQLINLLHEGRLLDSQEILQALNIPVDDVEATNLVYNQLVELQKFGLVKETSWGWRWI